MFVLPLLIVITTLISTTQGLMCTVGYATPDAQGHIPTDSITFLASVMCSTRCIVAFVKTAQHPTGQIVASCADSDSGCNSGAVVDVNTWSEIKCCSTDNCNSQNGNFPWSGYDWTTPRTPNIGSVTSAPDTTDAPTDAPTMQPTQAATIQCTVGTSVPDGQGGVIKQITTQPCATQCYATYSHSSFGPSNEGVITGGCSSDINRECSMQGTTVNPFTPTQWIEVKCCNTTDNCNAQDWNVGQYDWITPRNGTIMGTIIGTGTTATGTHTSTQSPTGTGTITQSPTGTETTATSTQSLTGTGTATGTNTQLPTGTGTTTTTTQSSTGTGSSQPSSKPSTIPTSQPIGGHNNNTLSSTGIHASSACSMILSPIVVVIVMMTSML